MAHKSAQKKGQVMSTKSTPELRYLWHPGTRDIFSGYGLVLTPVHLVGLVMIDRPTVADPHWLAEVEKTFGAYQLAVMTQGGERGMVCQMRIARESLPYLTTFAHPLTLTIRNALKPLLKDPPAVTLCLTWEGARRCWVSTIVKGGDDP